MCKKKKKKTSSPAAIKCYRVDTTGCRLTELRRFHLLLGGILGAQTSAPSAPIKNVFDKLAAGQEDVSLRLLQHTRFKPSSSSASSAGAWKPSGKHLQSLSSFSAVLTKFDHSENFFFVSGISKKMKRTQKWLLILSCQVQASNPILIFFYPFSHPIAIINDE